jgi:hypothetical protein
MTTAPSMGMGWVAGMQMSGVAVPPYAPSFAGVTFNGTASPSKVDCIPLTPCAASMRNSGIIFRSK